VCLEVETIQGGPAKRSPAPRDALEHHFPFFFTATRKSTTENEKHTAENKKKHLGLFISF